MSEIKNINTLEEALPMLRKLEDECGEAMPIYNVVTELLPYLDKADLQSVIDEANIHLSTK
jgi:hypothetical protein